MTYMNQFLHFLFLTEAGHFLLAYIGVGIVGTMPAPTAQSGVGYQWAFAALNFFASNWIRAKGPRVESSPNFAAAVAIQTSQGGTIVTPKV